MTPPRPTRFMFFDAETNGKVKDKKIKLSAETVDNWPRVIQLGWLLMDQFEEELSWGEYFITPDGWEIPTDQGDFWETHNLTMERCKAFGKPIKTVLELFVGDLQSADVVVAHNVNFDHKVVGAEMLRAGIKSPHRPLKVCTMESTVQYCRVKFNPKQRHYPGQKYAFPKLEQLYETIWPGSKLVQTHQAGEDVRILSQCFFELCKRHIIRFPAQQLIDIKKANP